MIHDAKPNGDLEKLPLLPLRGLLAYPNMMLKVDVGREKSIAAVEKAMAGDQRVLIVAQRDAMIDEPSRKDLYGVGTVAVIKHVSRLPDSTLRLLVEGESRALILDISELGDTQQCELIRIASKQDARDMTTEAHMRVLKHLFREYAAAGGGLSPELMQAVEGEDDPDVLPDMIAANALSHLRDKQEILEMRSVRGRLAGLSKILSREIQLIHMEKEIAERVSGRIEQHQKEYFLNEQMRAIREELGDDEMTDREELEERLKKSKISGEAREKTERELKRYARAGAAAPESAISRNYVEYMLDMPWGVYTKDRTDIERARKVLDQDHFGLEDVKKRILEFLAVRGLKGDSRGPILCLIGPPGVGKTSIARSIARALGRKFTRLSLGGMRDEAEIRGHRRTYVGALPGRIISSIKQCGSMNPVFLLDEIDKLTFDMHGDPASALLEALDPEQNGTFSDHYMEAPFDLSGVLFVTTANTSDTIPRPLLDRMELIEVNGYTLEEKTQIARGHLWPKQLKEHALTKSMARLNAAAIAEIIDGYTREAGVRSLERELAAICRKVAVKWLQTPEDQRAPIAITAGNMGEFLGARRYLREKPSLAPRAGAVNGLAWTPFGGETLSIEAAVMPGHGAVDLTGQLGDVMKESARAAYSYIRSRSADFSIPSDFSEHHDLHIHVPEGATPKDGPSAGVAMTCAMVSAITGRKARQDVAMTGEITLLGKVLPIGGVKEKLLAAHRMGIDTVLLPGGNEKDLSELPGEVRAAMRVNLIERVDQALAYVLTKA